MSSRNRIIIPIFVASVVLAIGTAAYFILRQFATTSHSLLLYTSRPSLETITNWIVNPDTSEKWEVGKGLAARGWSSSGKYLAFHTLSPAPIEIWVSDDVGGSLQQSLDSRQYPDLKITGYDWLSDEIILVNVVDKVENWGYVYALNINSLSFEMVNKGNFINISPIGRFWIQWAGRYELAGLDIKTVPLPDYLSDYYFSPTEDEVAYSCAGKYRFSSLCVADVSMLGLTNNRKVAENTFLNSSGEHWWSQDGKHFGFLYYSEQDRETKFRAIDISSGATIYDWVFPTKDTRIFWSPRGDKIIDWGGLLLDLKTGQVSNFFAEIGETTPSYIVDWRMIEVP